MTSAGEHETSEDDRARVDAVCRRVAPCPGAGRSPFRYSTLRPTQLDRRCRCVHPLRPKRIVLAALFGAMNRASSSLGYGVRRSRLGDNSQSDLDQIATELNGRPRQTLAWKTQRIAPPIPAAPQPTRRPHPSRPRRDRRRAQRPPSTNPRLEDTITSTRRGDALIPGPVRFFV